MRVAGARSRCWLGFTIALVAGGWAAAPAIAASEQIVNGGFEAGTVPWTYSGTGTQRCDAQCGLPPASGTYYGRLGPLSGKQAPPNTLHVDIGEISQNVTIPATPATLTLELRRYDIDSPTLNTYFDVIYDSVLITEVNDTPHNQYTTISVQLTPPDSSPHLLQLQAWCDNQTLATVTCDRYDIDDVSLISGPPPDAPVITTSDPVSPANENSPKVKGTLAAGSPASVKVFTNGSCAGSPAATGTPGDFTGAGIPVGVPDDSTTHLSAKATNPAGDSSCSNAITYVEATRPPETTIDKGPKKRTRKRKATFEFSSDEAGSHFECQLGSAAFVACASPKTVRAKRGKNTFRVRAIDQAGNIDGSPAAYSWKRKSRRR